MQENVKVIQITGGALSLSVSHSDPKMAAYYSNSFMEELRQLVENESFEAQSLRLNYLSQTLADALEDMEKTQANLKVYALENSARARKFYF